MARTSQTKAPPTREGGLRLHHGDDRSIAMTLGNLEQSELTASERDVLAQAGESARRLGAGAHLDDWLTLTPAVRIIRHLAMKLNHLNRPEGRGYVQSFGQLMQRHGLDKFDKTTITALLWLDDDPQRMSILREIRESMTPGERARLNSPITARQRVEKVLKARVNGTEEGQKDSPVKKLKDEIAKLKRDLAVAQEKLARKDDGSLFDLKLSTPDEIGAVFPGHISESKFDAIVKAAKQHYRDKRRKAQTPAG
jgi:hypothetical protein